METEPSTPPPSERTTLKRAPHRGNHERATIDAILDEAMICHIGFQWDDRPAVIPTVHARFEDGVVFHGSAASNMLRRSRGPAGGPGTPICLTVTLLDGLVLGRSAFHHSMNYRSVVVYGEATEIIDPARKAAALDRIVDHIVPDRRPFLRATSELETRKTMVLELPLTEASAKIRQGPPIDEDDDYDLDMWAGVIPLTIAPGPPVGDPASTQARPHRTT